MAILKKARELFVKNVNELSQGDFSGKQRVVRCMDAARRRRQQRPRARALARATTWMSFRSLRRRTRDAFESLSGGRL